MERCSNCNGEIIGNDCACSVGMYKEEVVGGLFGSYPKSRETKRCWFCESLFKEYDNCLVKHFCENIYMCKKCKEEGAYDEYKRSYKR